MDFMELRGRAHLEPPAVFLTLTYLIPGIAYLDSFSVSAWVSSLSVSSRGYVFGAQTGGSNVDTHAHEVPYTKPDLTGVGSCGGGV